MPNPSWNNTLSPFATARGAVSGPSASAIAIEPMAHYTGVEELQLGTLLEFEAWGEITTPASVTTFQFGVYYGATPGTPSNIIWAHTAQTPTASLTSIPWHFRIGAEVIAVGAAGTAQLYGHGILDISLTGLDNYVAKAMPPTAAARSIATVFTDRSAWYWGVSMINGAATAGNTCRCDIFNMDYKNQGKT